MQQATLLPGDASVRVEMPWPMLSGRYVTGRSVGPGGRMAPMMNDSMMVHGGTIRHQELATVPRFFIGSGSWGACWPGASVEFRLSRI